MIKSLTFLAVLALNASFALASPLNGTYTVGGADPHFATVREATQALIAQGIDGPVVINIRPGNYDGPINIPDIAGASAINTITLQAETGIASDVVVSYTSIDPASTALAVWQVSGDWVTLQYLTMQQNSVFSSVYGRVLEITGDVNHVTVRHCRLIGSTRTTTVHDRYAVLFNWKTSTYAADDILIEHNEILNGSVGIYWGGSTLFSGSGLRIRHNTVTGWGMQGIRVSNEPAVEITDNVVQSTVLYSIYPYGILMEECDGAVWVERNHVRTSDYIGIGVRHATATPVAHAIYANNAIYVSNNSKIGLDFYESFYQDALHNTVVTEGFFGSDVAVSYYFGGHNRLVGNIIQDNGSGGCLKVTFPATDMDQCDENLFHSQGGATLISSTYTTHTLAGWQSLFGLDANSLVDSAWFTSSDDLHLLPGSPGIDAASAGWVDRDVDFGLRGTSPDMGADEFGVTGCDVEAAVLASHCPGNTGAIRLSPLYGDGPFSYLWADGSTAQERTNLAAGNYPVSVSNGTCTWTDTVAVACLPPAPALQFGSTQTHVSCFGDCDGIITAVPLGGCPPYQYWIRGAGSGWIPATATTDGLCRGSYLLGIRDACGVMDTLSVLITAPPRLRPSLVFVDDVSCFGIPDGSLEISASGGTPPYQYSRNGGFTYQSSGYFDGLPANTYTMRIVDANGCSRGGNLTINQPDLLVLSLSSVTNESIPGAADGSITVSVTGGTGDMEFRLGTSGWQSSPTFGGLTAGSYVVQVQDEQSCQKSLNVVVGIGERLGKWDETKARVEPNPAQSWARFAFDGPETITAISLLDARGVVRQQWMQPDLEAGSLFMELDNLPAGWYWVQYRHDGGIGRVPLVIAE